MNKSLKQSGFTLIELSIVLIIGGIMVVAAIEAYTVYDEKRKIDQINTQMADLDQYIKNFPTMIDPATVDPATGIGTPYGRFPCPAPMDGTGAGNDFDSEDCTIAPIAGVQPDGSAGGAPVLIGKIPAATLGLSSDYMSDPHGNYLVYAITQSASNSATYGATSGSIQVIEEGIDRNPASATRGQIVELERHNNVQYMVVSMGDTDAGAYAFNGVQPIACPANTVKEHENCDGDASFITSLLHERAADDFYDDKLLFAANTVVVPNNEEPAECDQQEIFQIYAPSCPDGWSSVTTGERYNMQAYAAQSERTLNQDSDGNYYFSTIETPETILSNNNNGANSKITCEKNDNNPAKMSCFSKKLTYTTSRSEYDQPLGPSNSTYETYEDLCPEGMRVIDLSKVVTSSPAARGALTYTSTDHISCGK